MTELDTMYRVMILYMLNLVEYPLTNTQITNFVLEKEYTNYFTVQEAITSLLQTDLITAESTHNNAIKEDIRTYFQAHHFDLRQETAIFADYYKAANHGYAVRCRIQNQRTDLVDLTIHVQNRDQAEAVCRNWKRSNFDVYEMLMDTLIR